jgi:hypothetical protein
MLLSWMSLGGGIPCGVVYQALLPPPSLDLFSTVNVAMTSLAMCSACHILEYASWVRDTHVLPELHPRCFRRTAATREPTCFFDLLFAHKYLPITSITLLTAGNCFSVTFHPSVGFFAPAPLQQNIIPNRQTVLCHL